MNLLLDLEILGWLLVGLAGLLGIPTLAALAAGEPFSPYLLSAITAAVLGLPLAISARAPNRRMRNRDAFLVVAGGWLVASSFGALPYIFSGVLGPVDALFESASGFTTTGSTVMIDLESAPRALHLWRSLSQWVGGMGIIVFAVAILPLLGIGGMQMFKAEVPGPITDKLTPRVANTARRLWLIYVGLTGVAFLALWAAGMGPFDALCHALTTLSTGGFSTRSASLGAFSPLVQWLVVFFMFAAGMNFVLHHQLLMGRFRQVFRDSELRFYFATALVWVGVVAVGLASAGEAAPLRDAAFQVVSLLTTTGYGTADYELWPALPQLLLVPLLALGGMAGSTSGGLKSMRVVLGLRSFQVALRRIIHPHAVHTVRFNDGAIADDVIAGVGVFFIAYLLLTFLGSLVVGSAGYDVMTAVSTSLTAVSNVGPGFGAVGPTDNFAHLPAYVKLSLCLLMVAGRLEIFTLMVIFSPAFWRR